MDPSAVASWVSASCAVISLAGGGFAYWQAHLSKKARQDASKAESRAESHVQSARDLVEAARAKATAAEDTATSLRGLERSARRPMLEATHLRRMMYRLTNTGDSSITIEDIVSPEGLPRMPFELPCTIDAGRSIEALIAGSSATGPISALELRVEGRDELIEVAIPPRAD